MQRTIEFDFGSTIRAIRKRHGFSQRSLAIELGVSRMTVNRWERGMVFPNNENFAKLAKLSKS